MARKKVEDRMVIRDELLNPYEIVVDGGQNYTLRNPDQFKMGKTIGYFSTMRGAIKKAIELKISDREAVYSLNQYYNELLKLSKQIDESLKVLEE